ncbi:MMPL family transporter [Nocardia sp. 348MFTsu5.1]|uniref:MMPL family transporter n=1 Tax=Nocardia sp. 348MFTsu5.1 TaxID=1172185 RepID=UPI0003826AF3|nr:MMPL family transporter [Nocardia sp. 348MFTsu5.1]
MDRYAAFIIRRRWLVIGGWVVVLIGAIFAASMWAGPTTTSFTSDTRTEAGRAAELLEQAGQEKQANATQIVIAAPEIDGGVRNPDVEAQVTALVSDITASSPDVTVTDPYGPQSQISADGRIAVASLDVGTGTDAEVQDRIDDIKAIAEDNQIAGVDVEFSDPRFDDAPPNGAAEGVGVLLALIILLIAFGSVVAAGLPIVSALFGIGVGASVLFLVQNFMDIPNFAISVTLILGIGVGIDYALLIVTRYRSGIHDGLDVNQAVTVAMVRAGRSVLFAGGTVIIAMGGILLSGGNLGPALTFAAIAGILATLIASLSLLPALLAVIGTHINSLSLHWLRKRKGKDPNKALEGVWAKKWSARIQRTPWVGVAGAVLILLILSIPAFQLRLGFSDAGNRPTSATTRVAYDYVTEGFGVGANGPLIVVADYPAGTNPQAELETLRTAIAADPQVAENGVAPAFQVGQADGKDISIIQVNPVSGPQDEATTELVNRLRDETIPDALGPDSDVTVQITGLSAGSIDYAEVTLDLLPWTIAAVLAAAFILLVLAFRSIVVPVKAVIVNVLSLGAAFGVIVAIFQWGWGAGIFGVGRAGPIDSWVPMMLFVTAIGLSMDYEVFLVSRIKERYVRTGNATTSVAEGLASTARVITCAALIMICVFLSLVFLPDRSLKILGVGLAVAVFIDASVVRLLLVPSTMEILGKANWWFPTWLEWIPRLDGMHQDEDDTTPAEDPRVSDKLNR